MLKTQTFTLAGKDDGTQVVLTELPALVADRCARHVLKQINEPLEAGVVGLALKHFKNIRNLGEQSLTLLQPFVQNINLVAIKDWRNVERLQQAALYLHVGFLIGRDSVEVPVTLQAQALMSPVHDIRATFCSPHIASVLQSKMATYQELETVLSTEDVYNLVELINVDVIREWRINQTKAAQA